MKYFLEIDGVEYANCSQIDAKNTYRAESKQTSITGNLLIDRVGNRKIKLTAKVNALRKSDVDALFAAYDKNSVVVRYSDGETMTQKIMHINDFSLTKPIPYAENGLTVALYPYVKLTLDEI